MSPIIKSVLTPRALDVEDSVEISGIFLASSFFLLPSRVHVRPHACIPKERRQDANR